MSSDMIKLASRRDAAQKFVEFYVANAKELFLGIGKVIGASSHIEDGLAVRNRTFEDRFEVELKPGAVEAFSSRGGGSLDGALLAAITAWIQNSVLGSETENQIEIEVDLNLSLEKERLVFVATVAYF